MTSVETDTSTEVGAMAGEVRQRHIARVTRPRAISADLRQKMNARDVTGRQHFKCPSSVVCLQFSANIVLRMCSASLISNLKNAHIHSAARSSHHGSAPSLKVSPILVVETLVYNLVLETTTHG